MSKLANNPLDLKSDLMKTKHETFDFNIDDELINLTEKKGKQEKITPTVKTQEEKQEIKMMFNVLFDNLIMVLKNHDKTNNIYKVYLKDMDETYLKTTSDARKVIDYIAGMTDDYFTDEYNKIKKDNS